MRTKYVNEPIFAHLNIIPLRNKELVEFVQGKVNILMISEIKIKSFPLGQFKINGFNTPFCLEN